MSIKVKGTIRIGTSNIVVPGSKETFPLEFRDKSRLCYYAHLFNSVEVNSTFKKLPRPSTFYKWYGEVPELFQFTLKLLKDFTHTKGLEADLSSLNNFLETANALTDKKGCILIQFPGSITSELSERVELLLETLHELDSDNNWRKAVEFRSETWYTSETYTMLQYYNACLVQQDMLKAPSLKIRKTFPFYYFRYHGPQGDYRGSYSEEFLQEQAEIISDLVLEGRDVYVYFNNTVGQAFENAIYLKNLLEKFF